MLRRSSITRSSQPLRQKRKCLPGSEAKIKQELRVVFSLYIRQRDPLCVICYRPTTEAAHLWHRSMKSTEFDVENVWGNCHACNSRNEFEPQPMRDAVFKRIGERRYDELATRAHDQRFKLGYGELLLMLDELKRKVA